VVAISAITGTPLALTRAKMRGAMRWQARV